jgi:hypothetical protein
MCQDPGVCAGALAQCQRPLRHRANPIPERIITRPPSAELRPDQKDQDSLPPYEVLDAIIARYMEKTSLWHPRADGLRADVERVTRLIRINEYKRRQAPVGIRVTPRSFGKDWRYPITNKFRPEARGAPHSQPIRRTHHENDHRHHQALQAGRGARSWPNAA